MSDIEDIKVKFNEMNETHSSGVISIEYIPKDTMFNADLGIQISEDGRVWVCIDGRAFIRFNPNIKIPEKTK